MRVQALKSFDGKPGEGENGTSRVKRGKEFEVQSDNRVKELERRGLVTVLGKGGKGKAPSSTKTGAKGSPSSSDQDQAQSSRTSTDSADGTKSGEASSTGKLAAGKVGSVTINDTAKTKADAKRKAGAKKAAAKKGGK